MKISNEVINFSFREYFRAILKLVVVLGLFLIFNGCQYRQLGILQQEINTVADRYVPDKRTGIIHANISKAGNKLLLSGETLYPEAKAEIIGLIEKSGLLVADSMVLLPSEAVGEYTFALVTVSVGNVRSRPSHPAELVTQVVLGTPLRIIRQQPGWLQIQTPEMYLGWITTASVQRITSGQLEQWRTSDRLIFTGVTGNIMQNRGSERVVSDIVAGSIVKRVSETATHFEVMLPDGRSGFLAKEGCEPFDIWKEKANATQESITKTAARFLGLPYLWGGTSSKALDCSGFTKLVFFLNGYILERDASQQIRHGEIIPAENDFALLQPGDLLFYGTREPFRVVHVGIWMGDTEVIHASGIVQQESMHPGFANFSNYLHSTFIGEVRRMIGVDNSEGIIPVKEHPWY